VQWAPSLKHMSSGWAAAGAGCGDAAQILQGPSVCLPTLDVGVSNTVIATPHKELRV
jgi:hypothetical protein